MSRNRLRSGERSFDTRDFLQHLEVEFAARETRITLPQSPSDQPDRQFARFQHQPNALVRG
jgi:hypothetical protein